MKPCKAQPGHCPLKTDSVEGTGRHVEFKSSQAMAQWNAIQQCRDSLITDKRDAEQVFDSGQSLRSCSLTWSQAQTSCPSQGSPPRWSSPSGLGWL